MSKYYCDGCKEPCRLDSGCQPFLGLRRLNDMCMGGNWREVEPAEPDEPVEYVSQFNYEPIRDDSKIHLSFECPGCKEKDAEIVEAVGVADGLRDAIIVMDTTAARLEASAAKYRRLSAEKDNILRSVNEEKDSEIKKLKGDCADWKGIVRSLDDAVADQATQVVELKRDIRHDTKLDEILELLKTREPK